MRSLQKKQKAVEEITTENIEAGMVVKNYKELCGLIGIPSKAALKSGSNSQKSVLKEIERYIDYEKNNGKYYITEVYDTPLPKVNKRLEGLHSQYINILLCGYLLTKDSLVLDEGKPNPDRCVHVMKPISWFRTVGLCNDKYKNYECRDEVLDKLDTTDRKPSTVLSQFYMDKDKRFKQYFNTALRQMKDARLIDYYEKVVLVFSPGDDDVGDRAIATESELDIIRETERVVLTEMGLKSMFQMQIQGKSPTFYNRVVAKLRATKKGRLGHVYRYYKAIEIRYTKSLMLEGLQDMLLRYQMEYQDLYEMAIKENNDNVIDSYEKANVYPVVHIGKPSRSMIEDYEAEKYLIDTLLKIDDAKITQLAETLFYT